MVNIQIFTLNKFYWAGEPQSGPVPGARTLACSAAFAWRTRVTDESRRTGTNGGSSVHSTHARSRRKRRKQQRRSRAFVLVLRVRHRSRFARRDRAMEWNNGASLALIEEYKHQTVLWNSRHGYHYSKVRKQEAWETIAYNMQLGVDEVRQKMNSLLGSFRRERSKMRRGVGKYGTYRNGIVTVSYTVRDGFRLERILIILITE